MYQLFFTRQALKTLRNPSAGSEFALNSLKGQALPRNTADHIREKLLHLAEAPCASNANVTSLQNRPGYRLRIGDWRVIYEIEDEQLRILILKVAPRGEVYR